MADGSGAGPAVRDSGPGAPAATGPASLSARAREAVLQRIVDRRYAQGARLVEREVAEELSMSRVPVREALRALVAEGLLELLPHSGVRVRRLEYTDVEHLYEVWEPLAVQASRLAARAVAAGDTRGPAGLRATLGQAESAAASDEGTREVAAHTAFHDGVVAMSGNPLLVRTMEQLSWQLRLLFGMREEPAHMRAQHAEMYRHICAGDAEAAAASTLLHVRDSRAVALRSLFGDA
ncbi:GntR family transcriptional regulator [Streptomyces sp. NBC_01201]|uniref:GntR family transcriptional regulator n=1 Tax=Streptomyces glycanivorans TaxID=3033808 RepID=A0ABY9JAY2_9ACTN|nr:MULTISPECIES: GntR family transcriptional regulator [unclassified Streptomyces]WLQ63282.1 GntR family transcriptional regulator [Streptomyces sp. Alt3]WSQ76792.1 GntR family transcriptional regulator [Streptomyces sp. NBC_01213]WSQ84125.1 GntR family transcriptional regulator [Streptomyces sp. NBC_01212]WSR47347.1 GntR family transcriptional regulator [Streptomyces sp. NBC_01201]